MEVLRGMLYAKKNDYDRKMVSQAGRRGVEAKLNCHVWLMAAGIRRRRASKRMQHGLCIGIRPHIALLSDRIYQPFVDS